MFCGGATPLEERRVHARSLQLRGRQHSAVTCFTPGVRPTTAYNHPRSENDGIIFSPKSPGQVCNANIFLVCSQLRKKCFSVVTISRELTTSNKQKKTEKLFLTTLASRFLMIYSHLLIDKRHKYNITRHHKALGRKRATLVLSLVLPDEVMTTGT